MSPDSRFTRDKALVEFDDVGAHVISRSPPSGHLYEFYYQLESYLQLTHGMVTLAPKNDDDPWLDVGDEFDIPFTVTNTAPWRVAGPAIQIVNWPKIYFTNVAVVVAAAQHAKPVGSGTYPISGNLLPLKPGQSATVAVRMIATSAFYDPYQPGETVANARVTANFDFNSYSMVQSDRVVVNHEVFP